MKVEWSLAAANFFDQLSFSDRSRVRHAAERLDEVLESAPGAKFERLKTDSDVPSFAYRVSPDLRLVFERRQDKIVILDVIRRGQLEGLRNLRRSAG
jgi:hypothetical protein